MAEWKLSRGTFRPGLLQKAGTSKTRVQGLGFRGKGSGVQGVKGLGVQGFRNFRA